MKIYRYPENLQAKPKLWLWNVPDFIILCIGAVISALCFVKTRTMFPLAATICYAFITLRTEDTAIIDYIRHALHFFVLSQQEYYWQKEEDDHET